jgi:hypothetical protein
MPDSFKSKAHNALKVAIAASPWVISMYALYWLEYGEIWTTETAHRGKISVAILTLGMVASLLLHSHFARRK